MEKVVLVIAGNHDQYLRWLFENGKTSREAKYISSAEMVAGLGPHNAMVEFVGETHRNSRYDDIYDALMIRGLI